MLNDSKEGAAAEGRRLLFGGAAEGRPTFSIKMVFKWYLNGPRSSRDYFKTIFIAFLYHF